MSDLIETKKLLLQRIDNKKALILSKNLTYKYEETKLLLETDFKELGLTNEKMRNSYVSDSTYKLRFRLDMAKYELKQEEDELNIINDLITYRLKGE